jgi:hypothetical protein
MGLFDKLFGRKQRATEQQKEDNKANIQDALFGDQTLSSWASHEQSGEPWDLFTATKKEIDSGNILKAIEVLKSITDMEGLESRHYIQAWYFLRMLGINPDDSIAKRVYGVVVEVALNQGIDIVAAYEDCSARYYNYSGAGVVWEKPNNSLDNKIIDLLNAGKQTVIQIGPWEDKRPPAPVKANARVSMLTPSGLHFGEGPMKLIASDSKGGPIITAAFELMQELINIGGMGNKRGTK